MYIRHRTEWRANASNINVKLCVCVVYVCVCDLWLQIGNLWYHHACLFVYFHIGYMSFAASKSVPINFAYDYGHDGMVWRWRWHWQWWWWWLLVQPYKFILLSDWLFWYSQHFSSRSQRVHAQTPIHTRTRVYSSLKCNHLNYKKEESPWFRIDSNGCAIYYAM